MSAKFEQCPRVGVGYAAPVRLFGVNALELVFGEAPRDVIDALVHPGCGRCRPALENGDLRHAVGAASIAALGKQSGIGPQSRP